MSDKSSDMILLEMVGTKNGAMLASALVTALSLARTRMASGDYDDWCDAIVDAALDA